MVSSLSDLGAERRRMTSLPRANRNYVETFTEVEDTAENCARGNITSGNEMTGDITSRIRPRIVEIILRRENGESETYLLDSMTKRKCRLLMQDLRDFMPADGHKARYTARQATSCLQESFAFDGHAEAMNANPMGRDPNSSASSDSGRSHSDREGKTGDSTRNNRRKRARNNSLESARISEGLQHRSPEIPQLITRASLKIADENAVMAYYKQILADGQQTLCKKLAKWWIRAINPNKQTNYPYAKGSEKKPPWWPLTPPKNAVGVASKGTAENGLVRHKEPDHLAKPERLTLLPHVLNQVTDPRNRSQLNDINVTKLHQISIDSINNETADKDKHESWRRFVNEIFRVARQQERYKDGETDEATVVPVLPSYNSWRKGSADEAEEDYESDGEYDDVDSGSHKILTPRSPSHQDLHTQTQIQPQSPDNEVKQEISSFVHETCLRPNFQDGLNGQPSYRDVDDGTNQVSSHQSYGVTTGLQSRPYQQSTLILQEPFRRHSDTSGRFSNQSSFAPFLPSTNVTQIANSHYQTVPPHFQYSTTSSSPIGPVLPLPMSAPMTRPLAEIQHFPAFNDAGLFTRSTTAFEPSVRDPILGSHGQMLQLSQQQESFQDFLHSHDYDHNALKMHSISLNHTTSPGFRYDHETVSSASRSEFAYDVKRRCSLDSRQFSLDDMVNGESNGHSEH